MINDSNEAAARRPGAAPSRPPYEVFCIHSYAGELGPRCGWQGRASDALRIEANGPRRCPRCGRATLMDIVPPADPRAS